MWKRYECPTFPTLLMFGQGGKKQFSSGVFITDDEDKQAGIETSDRFGIAIQLAAESEVLEELAPQPTAIEQHLRALEAEREAQPPPEIHVDPEAGTVEVVGSDVDPNMLTPEQRIKIAFLSAGFDKGTNMDVVLEEMGVDMSLPPADVADVVEERLASMIDEMRGDGAEKEPEAEPETPTRTAIRRMNHDGLMEVAQQYAIPGAEAVVASVKGLRKLLLEHFHGSEKAK